MNMSFLERRKAFNAYLKSDKAWVKKGRPEGEMNTCPCCGFPTLAKRGDYGVCVLCRWEDDGISDDDELDSLGANGDYTLREARLNFENHLTMYRPTHKSGYESCAQKTDMKLALIAVYYAILASDWEFMPRIEKLWDAEKMIRDAISCR